jgi:hypothetical protein
LEGLFLSTKLIESKSRRRKSQIIIEVTKLKRQVKINDPAKVKSTVKTTFNHVTFYLLDGFNGLLICARKIEIE